MKFKRIMSALLAVLMLMSALVLVIGAEEETETEPDTGFTIPEYTYNTNSYTSLMKKNPEYEAKNPKNADKYLYQTGEYMLLDGTTGVIMSAADKLKTMDLRYANEAYGLYVDAYSGEVAVYDWETGETLFSNPYTVGLSSASISKANTVKEELLSQLIINFTNIEKGSEETYLSYVEATERSQVNVKNIKGGIRVEYSIGREATKSLVPRQILVETFDRKILSILREKLPEYQIEYSDDWVTYEKILAFFIEKNVDKAKTAEERDAMIKDYPVTEKAPIYVLMGDAKESEKAWLEQMFKLYCPDYSFSDLDADHQEAGYVGTAEVYPLFKMALEYTLDEKGLVARLPANGIRFDETRYRLNYIQILPYMGAGTDPNTGANFFPDGSGTLFDFQEIESLGNRQEVYGMVYGQDYAYHEVSGKYEEIIRYPVFGISETQNMIDADGNPIAIDRGFVAIVEEGDSLMRITSYHAGSTSEYHTMKMTVYPRPTDSYNIADAISVGSNSEWTVVSSRKYTGSYKVRYIMLNDDSTKEVKGDDYYECSYTGMAKAYREYLEEKGVLSRLTASDVETDIPLYIETFGAVFATKKILSIPVDVTLPLTSFKDITTMYGELSAQGVKNINFILTGYTDGGLEAESVPYKLKWDSAVEDDMDFEELLTDAKANGYGIFPDFDFVFASSNTMFDGLTLSKHAVKTIDDRYTSKREYSATKHTYVSYFELALSPAYFSHFYEKFVPKYMESNPIGISVSTLGSYLNSDFDEDEPYNRADGQAFTVQAFEYLREQFANAEVLTSGGNAYTWKYIDHLTDIATDSSRFIISSASVPFLGMVLHGYVEIAGEPINMEGNLEYAFLKSLESGASLNFILAYQNTQNLKEYEITSHYYSIRYDIWFDDVVSMYNELNELLKDVQTSTITEHRFLGTNSYEGDYSIRVPDDDELAVDANTAIQSAIQIEQNLKNTQAENQRKLVLAARKALEALPSIMESEKVALDAKMAELNAAVATINELLAKPETTALQLMTPWVTATSLAQQARDLAAPMLSAYLKAEAGLEVLKGVEGFDEWHLANLTAAFEAQDIKAVEKIDSDLVALMTTTYSAIKTAKADFAGEEFTYAPTINGSLGVSLGSGVSGNVSVALGSKYQSDKNMVVYEAYENGKAFLLNFNDYRVIVYFEGQTYTIDAYGYVVLPSVS